MDEELEDDVEVTSTTVKPKKRRSIILSGWCMTGYPQLCRAEVCEYSGPDHRRDVEPNPGPSISPAMQELIRKYYPS